MSAQGISPHNQVMEIHKKFSIPVACFVFAILGLALGATSRKDGKLAAFVLGIGVIFAYYVVMYGGEALAKGHWLPAWLAMWLPNFLLGAIGIAAAGLTFTVCRLPHPHFAAGVAGTSCAAVA